MNPLSYLKIGGGVAAVIVLALLLYFANDRFVQKDKADDAKACASASGDLTSPLDSCLPALKLAIEHDRRARVCDAALLPSLSSETRFAMQQSCPAGVKALVARMDGAEANAADYLRQLGEQHGITTAAITRAEARATKQEQRESNAQAAISAAPRDAGGRITCDADCLRRIGGS